MLGLGAGRGEAQEDRVFNLVIKNRKLAGDVKAIRLKQGDTVKMNWTTDEATEIHLHGYDIKRSLMVFYTVASLWILAQPIVETSPEG